MSGVGIYNYIPIDETVATAGQPTEGQFREAREAGLALVINLASDGLETSLAVEDVLLESLGIAYHHIPVDWANPRIEDLGRFEALMGSLDGKPTLIHCQANHRVTTFFAMYATAKLGRDDARADTLMDRIWRAREDYEMDANWKNFMAAARRR